MHSTCLHLVSQHRPNCLYSYIILTVVFIKNTDTLRLHQQVTRKSKKREILKDLNINITVQPANSIFFFDFHKIAILIMSIRLILKMSKSITIPNPIPFLVNSSFVFNIILSLVFFVFLAINTLSFLLIDITTYLSSLQ